MPAITSTLAVSITDMAKQNYAMAVIDLTDGAENILAPQFHIVIRADADGTRVCLVANNMLCCRDKFFGQPAMSY